MHEEQTEYNRGGDYIGSRTSQSHINRLTHAQTHNKSQNQDFIIKLIE